MLATASGKRASFASCAPARGLLGRPSLDFRPDPELDSPFAEVENGSRHVVVPMLVDAHSVPVRQPKHLGDSLRIYQVLDCNLLGHGKRRRGHPGFDWTAAGS